MNATWFHADFRMDDWLLFELDSPITRGGRGIGRGLLDTQAGGLVGSWRGRPGSRGLQGLAGVASRSGLREALFLVILGCYGLSCRNAEARAVDLQAWCKRGAAATT